MEPLSNVDIFFNEIIVDRRKQQAGLLVDLEYFAHRLSVMSDDEDTLRSKLSVEKDKEPLERNSEEISRLESEINIISETNTKIKQYSAIYKELDDYLNYLVTEKDKLSRLIEKYI
jgi:hypothetical protein